LARACGRANRPVRSSTTLLNRFNIESFQYSTAKGAASHRLNKRTSNRRRRSIGGAGAGLSIRMSSVDESKRPAEGGTT
jgi:hypothetical protein